MYYIPNVNRKVINENQNRKQSDTFLARRLSVLLSDLHQKQIRAEHDNVFRIDQHISREYNWRE